MARKSRKNLLQPEQATVSVQFPELDEEKIPTAIYGRLSVEDDEDNESMETQIALVQDFINRSSELNYVDTYFDNGFTGTNFKRPAFTRLMNDVRQKKIKCIVVKDLSRFGRNYLEAGYYIETVFPFLGVRLIAVTDHFDSTRKEDNLLYGICGSIGMILAGLGGFAAFLALLDGSYAQAAASALVALLLCPFAAPMLLSLAGSALIVTAAALFAWLF